MKFFFAFILLINYSLVFTQNVDTPANILQSITIKAFEQNRKIKDVPAAVGYMSKQRLEMFNSASIVSAVNTTAGVRMEERSPGSYRLNIRGSSLRAPFGVRNVKVYYNDIPYTDPGGNTYFNNLGYYNFSSIEIIKGPGSSLYGAGTGGVLLVESLIANEKNNVFSEYTAGSFGLQNMYASVSFGSDDAKNKIGFQHQQSDGYRNHSELERNILSWNGRFNTSENSYLKTTFLYSHLFYETPGALTKAEYEANPQSSRPAGGGFPGAEQAKASIQQKTFLAGISYTHQFSETFSNNSVAYGMFTELRNPAIRNFGKNEEPHTGGRTSFSFKKDFGNSRFNLVAGGEIQQGFASVFIYKNRNGQPDTLQTLDEIRVRQSLLFLQAAFETKGWELTAGGSLNFLSVNFKRSAPVPLPQQERSFDNEAAPRLSLAKKWKAITVYTSVAKGFSPPTSTELLPSGSAINLTLNAEKGINYDIGFRGSFKNLSFDINAFLFSLENTIVQRRDAGGGEFFTNAGKTMQRGIETTLNYPFLRSVSFLAQTNLWLSHTYHHFRYDEFKQLTIDFSGNRLPGVAPHTISTGVDILAKNGISANINYNYSDKIPLNDANSEYANSYHLLNTRVGFEKRVVNKWLFKLGIGAENILDQRYSLGNDINAFGGRYYNAAPERAYFASLTVEMLTK